MAATLVPGVGPRVAARAVLDSPDGWPDASRLPARARAPWRAAGPGIESSLDAELEALGRLGATWLSPLDARWPATLPPHGVLRVRGTLAAASLAIVGARGADPYGQELAGRVAESAVALGWGVVSGGAFGIDVAAHRAALDAGGHTTVVLGAGLPHASPTAHAVLFERIAAEGGLVSPFPCAQRPSRHTFPRRNAWIAGLARAVVVVQAGVRSGALHTVRAAEALERPVWAAPGPLDSPLHRGCHRLVVDGRARLLMDVDAWAPDLRAPAGEPVDEPDDEPDEAVALWRAAGAEPRPLAELARVAGVPVDEASGQALLLELGGWLRAAPGGRYARSAPRRTR